MSYKFCVFAVPSTTSREALLGELAPMARELRTENGYREVYLVESTDAEIAATGVRVFNLLADPAPRGRISREFFTERWSVFPLYALIYDDQNGVFGWFKHLPDYQREGILSDGHRVGASKALVIDADYPQKPFTIAQLDELVKKDPGDLSDAEWNAVGEYHNAIRVGAAHYKHAVTSKMLFDLLRRTSGHALIANAAEKVPSSAGAVIDFYVEPYQFKSFGLPPREAY